MARSALAVLASSAPSEGVFSQAGLVMTDMRNRLKPGHLVGRLQMNSLDLIELGRTVGEARVK